MNRRIDDLIGTLLLIEEDLFHDRMRKEVMKDSKEASLRSEGNDRHSRGMEIPDSSVEVARYSYISILTHIMGMYKFHFTSDSHRKHT